MVSSPYHFTPPVPTDFNLHRRQDYQSHLMHVAAVRLLEAEPALVERAIATLLRWRESADPRSLPLLDEWEGILRLGDWDTRAGKYREGRAAASGVTTFDVVR